jgi:NAD(P)-dependent dehydrogenase (short-subunit alcohol dehydrogenase family)
MPLTEWQFSLHFFGAVRADRAVLPHMRAAGCGHLVHVTSLMGRVVFPLFGTYSASKFALKGLAEAYRYELEGFGIDSVIVEPAPFPSDLISSSPQPSDQVVLASYGEVAAIPGHIKAHSSSGQDEANPPRPQRVADAIVALVEATRSVPFAWFFNNQTRYPLRCTFLV